MNRGLKTFFCKKLCSAEGGGGGGPTADHFLQMSGFPLQSHTLHPDGTAPRPHRATSLCGRATSSQFSWRAWAEGNGGLDQGEDLKMGREQGKIMQP